LIICCQWRFEPVDGERGNPVAALAYAAELVADRQARLPIALAEPASVSTAATRSATGKFSQLGLRPGRAPGALDERLHQLGRLDGVEIQIVAQPEFWVERASPRGSTIRDRLRPSSHHLTRPSCLCVTAEHSRAPHSYSVG